MISLIDDDAEYLLSASARLSFPLAMLTNDDRLVFCLYIRTHCVKFTL
jgi:hypothetical protein